MRSKFFALFLVVSSSILMAACSGTPQPNTGSGNGNTAPTNGNGNAVAVTTPAPDATVNDAPTLTPVFKAYCAAMIKKDEAGLRKVYSSDTIKDFEQQMKEEKIKTLVKFLEIDQVTNELCEARNETITGDTAVAEIRTVGYPKGIKILFVKEGGEWKMTTKRPPGSLQ